MRLTAGARELLSQLPPAAAMRRWMDLFGDWIAYKNGMLETLLSMIQAGEIGHDQTRTELLTAITTILNAGRVVGDLRPDAPLKTSPPPSLASSPSPPGHSAKPMPVAC